MNLIYCYGVIKEEVNTDKKGFEEENIYLISFKDIKAIVSNVSEENFSQETIDKNIEDLEWIAVNGKIHESVVGFVMDKATVIPMKFCTIFKDKNSVEKTLEEKYIDLKYNLNNLNNKVEIGVKVYFDSKNLKNKLLEDFPEIKKMEIEAKKKSSGIAYFENLKIDAVIKQKLYEELKKEKKGIYESIKTEAQKARKNELLRKNLTKKDMLLNAVFLIEKTEINKFKNHIKSLEKNHRNMELQTWGPFPPYNFVK